MSKIDLSSNLSQLEILNKIASETRSVTSIIHVILFQVMVGFQISVALWNPWVNRWARYCVYLSVKSNLRSLTEAGIGS